MYKWDWRPVLSVFNALDDDFDELDAISYWSRVPDKELDRNIEEDRDLLGGYAGRYGAQIADTLSRNAWVSRPKYRPELRLYMTDKDYKRLTTIKLEKRLLGRIGATGKGGSLENVKSLIKKQRMKSRDLRYTIKRVKT